MQRYFGIKKEDNRLILDSSDYHHIKNVMRNSDGDLIEVVIDNKLYLGCIENVKSDISIFIKKELETDNDFIPKVNLIVPLLKENKMDLILQKSCEMGVSKVTIVPLKRCIVKVNEKKMKSKIDRWMRILKEASEQSFRDYIPNLEVIDSIKKLEKLDGLIKNYGVSLVIDVSNSCLCDISFMHSIQTIRMLLSSIGQLIFLVLI